MNIALEKTEEYVNGKKRRSYGDAFVRGNNGKHPFALDGRAAELTTTSYVHLSRIDEATASQIEMDAPRNMDNRDDRLHY
jgi:hypothetical protein